MSKNQCLYAWVTMVIVGLIGPSSQAEFEAAKIISLKTGSANSCALRSDGRVKCWGRNDAGQLGLGDTLSRGSGPGQMGEALAEVNFGQGLSAKSLFVGDGSSCAILSDGSTKCWGSNQFGQLGLGDYIDRGGSPNSMGDALSAVDLGKGQRAVLISIGYGHACAILENHSLKCWGANDSGQLGLGDTAGRGGAANQMGDQLPVIDLGTGRTANAVVCGTYHTCALLDDQTVKCWGGNSTGQLGQGDSLNRGGGPAQMGDHLKPVNLGKGARVLSITGGGSANCAVLVDGRVKCFGENSLGQLGLEDQSPRGISPGQMGDHLPPVNIEPGLLLDELNCGGLGCCARVGRGLLKCWGYGSNGALGYGDPLTFGDSKGSMGTSLPFVNLGRLRSAATVSVGLLHTCAIVDDGKVKCWGYNSDGRLGLGDTQTRGDRPETVPAKLPEVLLW